MGKGKPLQECAQYERVRSTPIKKLFPNSHASIEYFIQYKEKLALTIANTAANTILHAADFAPGEYKLLLEPEKGNATAFLFESLKHQDIIGLKLIRGRHNGEEARIVEIRYKKKASVAQKGVELDLGAPRMKATMSADTYSDALAELQKAMEDPDVSPKKKEKLAPLYSALEAERQGQEYMFREACGNNPATVAKAKAILSEISKELSGFDAASGLIAPHEEDRERKIAVENYVGAIQDWPFLQEGAMAKQFFKALSLGNQEFLGHISKAYLTNVLPRVFGVAALEYTALDSISQMQNILRLLHSKTLPSEEKALLDTIRKLDGRFPQIEAMIKGAAREQDDLACESISFDSERWFAKLCSTVNTRRKLLNELLELEKIANELDPDAACRTQLKKIIANMAFNLCRIDKEEMDLLDSFIRHPKVHHELAKLPEFRKKPFDNIRKRLHDYVDNGGKEAKKAQEFLPAEKNGGEIGNRTKFKQKKSEIDRKIYERIIALQAAAPALGDILLADFRRSKAHVGYKQGETLSHSPENHLTRLRIAQRLHELSPDPISRKMYSDMAQGYLGQAAQLFALLWENHGARKAILDIIRPMRHVPEKGFDLVGSPEKHIEQGNTHAKLVAKYSVKNENERDVLEFAIKGDSYRIDMGPSRIYEAGHLPLDFGESEKSVHEDIYGGRISLSELMPAMEHMTPQAIFSELYAIASRDWQKFDSIRKDMAGMNMENANFPSTLAFTRHRHSGCVGVFGNGFVVENLPLKLDDQGKNTFALHFSRLYPDGGTGAAESKAFAHQQAARRAVAGLGVNKSHIAKEYIKAVLAEGE